MVGEKEATGKLTPQMEINIGNYRGTDRYKLHRFKEMSMDSEKLREEQERYVTIHDNPEYHYSAPEGTYQPVSQNDNQKNDDYGSLNSHTMGEYGLATSNMKSNSEDFAGMDHMNEFPNSRFKEQMSGNEESGRRNEEGNYQYTKVMNSDREYNNIFNQNGGGDGDILF